MPACIFKFLAKRTLHLENQGVRFLINRYGMVLTDEHKFGRVR